MKRIVLILALLVVHPAFADLSEDDFFEILDYAIWVIFSPFILLALITIFGKTKSIWVLVFLILGLIFYYIYNSEFDWENFNLAEFLILFLLLFATSKVLLRRLDSKWKREAEEEELKKG